MELNSLNDESENIDKNEILIQIKYQKINMKKILLKINLII